MSDKSTYKLSHEPLNPTYGDSPPAPRPVTRPPRGSPRTGSLKADAPVPERLVSLDAYRGFIMVMLAANGFGIYQLLSQPEDAGTWKIVDREAWEKLAFHFEHPPWGSSFVPGTRDATVGSPWLHFGVSFWDLIQPAFMFMVGVSMPFSFEKRRERGDPVWKLTCHAALRAIVLILLGVFLYSLNCDRTNWIFPNVLAQIGLGYFFAYLLLDQKLWVQLTALAVILVGYWGAFAWYTPPANYDPQAMGVSAAKGEFYTGFFHHWSKHAHLGTAVDEWLLNLFPRPTENGRMVSDPETNRVLYNGGGYVTLNFVPSIATMLLGILCGQILLIPESHSMRLGILAGAAVTCLVLGVLAGATVCPIVKRIWTPSWVLFSGGYVIGMLALFYLLFDALPLKKLAFPLVVVGMNSLAIYLLGQLSRPWISKQVVSVHFQGLIEWLLGQIGSFTGMLDRLDAPPAQAGKAMYTAFAPIVDATATFAVMWLFLYWMYRQRFFIKA